MLELTPIHAPSKNLVCSKVFSAARPPVPRDRGKNRDKLCARARARAQLYLSSPKSTDLDYHVVMY